MFSIILKRSLSYRHYLRTWDRMKFADGHEWSVLGYTKEFALR